MTNPITESALEQWFLDQLSELKYIIRHDIRDRAALERNFREKFEELNHVSLLDSEFSRLHDEIVSADAFAAAKILRNKNTFIRDDGTPLNYTLVNLTDWCKNYFEVVSQLKINTDYSHHRYDVILLINGVPVVQVELKTLGVKPSRAMEQIVEYKNDPGNGYTKTLLCFIQLFIVSNRDHTYYFANNNTRHFAFNADERFLPVYQFADRENNKVSHLEDFSKSFLSKCVLSQMLSRYMVLVQSEQKLLVMRPYQIYAVQAIVDCIHQNNGNGYVWHTTGSGKTLTSFKASTLLKDNPDIEKCVFVVDRKDLDRQTREEFNRFQEGCVEENTNTATLVRRLLSDDYAHKVIVTTIQKLGLALDEASKRNKQRRKDGKQTYTEMLEPLQDKRVVFIFDECHRSQFGDNHQAIKEFFPRAQMFGFTGTPIFSENATYRRVEGEEQTLKTTEDLFHKLLHAYTITHAIDDGNVLRFHVDYFEPQGKDKPKPGQTVAKKKVVEAILEKHDVATGGRRFNAILATGKIDDAIEYFELFQSIQAERANADSAFEPLKIAAVFSPPAQLLKKEDGASGEKNAADVKQLQEDLDQERADNEVDPDKKKKALEAIIADYNKRYGTNHRIGEFDLYYQDVQKRIKDQQWPNADLPRKGEEKIDITIVVDMLLTGFDSKYLNTLYVDKNLKHHGLIQALSRTNRILNATKPYGSVLDFRGQRDSVDEAIAMFSGVSTERARQIWLVDKAPVVIEKLKKAKAELDEFLKTQGVEARPESVANLKGDAARIAFVEKFKEVQRLTTQLDQYTDLKPEQRAEIDQVVPKDDLRAFRGAYLETAQRLRDQQRDPGVKPSPGLDQLDFELVLFASALIDYDYIMGLIAKYTGKGPKKLKLSLEQLIGIIQSEAKFIDERDMISDYVRSLATEKAMDESEVKEGYRRFKAARQAAELFEIADRHGLSGGALQAFVDKVLERKIFDGEKLTELMEPLGLGWKDRAKAEISLMDELEPLLQKLSGGREISGLNAYESKQGKDDL
jgi:type I restriction enzyme R subunit